MIVCVVLCCDDWLGWGWGWVVVVVVMQSDTRCCGKVFENDMTHGLRAMSSCR